MTEPLTPPYWNKAIRELSKADPVLRAIIRSYKGELMKTRGDAFFTLARSIIGQQISVKAADSVWKRLMESLGNPHPSPPPKGEGEKKPSLTGGGLGGGLTPRTILSIPDEALRACGLSGSKVNYLKSLAQHFTDNPYPDWSQMTDDEAIKWLVEIKGIGRWTAEMFLIFHLMRPDVFPLDDIGLQKGIERHYGKGKKMTRKQMEKLGKNWQPWRSVATWYFWRSLDPLPVEY